MQPEIALPAAFAVAALSTAALTPAAIRLALRTEFMDQPVGYKGHGRPTPYLGGVALAGGVTLAALVAGAAGAGYAVLLCCALGLFALGTLDDRRNLSPWTRVALELAAGVALWATGHGWDVFGSAPADGALTVLWVVGVVNAFNLMDNMNGAAATCAALASLGAGVLALDGGQEALAALCVAIAGACAGFLPFNLARPSRIFMGDGGSMLLGCLVAGVAMSAASIGAAQPTAVIVAALVAGLPIFDTVLVSISRRRGGRALLSGGRDHLTHRLARRLGSAQRVPAALAAGQLALSVVALGAMHAGSGWVLSAGAAAVLAGAWAVWVLETPLWFDAARAARGHADEDRLTGEPHPAAPVLARAQA